MKATVIYKVATVRRSPTVSAEEVGTLEVGTVVEYSEIIRQEPGMKEWIKLYGSGYHGRYIASLFPDGRGNPISRVQFEGAPEPPDPPDPPVPPEPKINFAVVNYTDETGTHEVTLFPK
ncbi:MAG: hypothetical protein A2Y54_10670 [Chloroflexi bacterium RBG_16_51_16]|nr:MAG: hypothetical protein A2Y54_10670 [Chloroflexi bacterium RBG_16_51_16]